MLKSLNCARFCRFFNRGCGFAYVVVVFERYELRVHKRVFDVFVSEQLHYVEDVFGFVVFHRCFPVSECVEGYLVDSWVSEFSRDSLSLACE